MSELCSIVDGDVDDLPETAFYNVGTIDEAREKAKKLTEAALCSMRLRVLRRFDKIAKKYALKLLTALAGKGTRYFFVQKICAQTLDRI